MKFILINGRTPRPKSACVSCREPIGTGYLREIATRLCYCDDDATSAIASAVSLPSKIMRGHREFEAGNDVWTCVSVLASCLVSQQLYARSGPGDLAIRKACSPSLWPIDLSLG
jgi:hypothetical protein